MIPQVSILLHDIRSTHNVGSIFRTADGFGVSTIYVSGHTPAPIDRFGRVRADIAKVALGAEKSMKWEQIGEQVAGAITPVIEFIKKIRKTGVLIVALEQDKKAVDLSTFLTKFSDRRKILLIVGNEVDGVVKEFLDLADVIVEIPMLGMKESLNVSVATGIALYELTAATHRA